MAISFGSAPGLLFPRLGKVGALITNIRSHQNTQNTAMTDTTTGVVAQFNGESDIQAIMGSSYIGILNGVTSAGATAQQLARMTVSRMIYRDNPQQGQSLTSENVSASLDEIIRQMKAAGATVLAMSMTTSASAFTGVGNGTVVAAVRRPFDGKVLENAYAESINVRCDADSYSGNATAGNETMGVTGDGGQGDFFAFDWPLGSNGSTSLSAVDGSASNSAGNILTNSGWDAWASSAPSNWTIAVGAAAVDVNQETSIVFGASGSSALRILGDGSTLVELRQLMNDAAGTSGKLESQRQYSVALWARRDGVAPAAGNLRIELTDGNNAVVNDENGVANSFDVDLTALSTVYAAYSGVFRTPAIMPASHRVRLRLTTALTSGRSVYLDRMGIGEMTQLYVSGPFLNVHSGSTPFLLGDYATVTVTNGRGSGGTLTTWQTLLARLFPGEVYGSELLFPSSTTPTVADGLIG